MPPASTSRQPDPALAWFDSAEGSAVLGDEMGLLMPLLVRCTGSRICHVLPTAQSAAKAQPTLMPLETRLWCNHEGWHSETEFFPDGPPQSLQGMDLIIAAHVIGTLPDPAARLSTIFDLLAAGKTAFFVEFCPNSLFRCRWRKHSTHSLSLRRMVSLLKEAGFAIDATYAMRPRSSEDSSGMLLRHNWRLPTWLPLRAYVIRAHRVDPGMTVAAPPGGFFVEAPNA